VKFPANSDYVDSGANAKHNIDGDISASVEVPGCVNTAVVGSYTLTCNVSDFAGNEAVPVSRTVDLAPAVASGRGRGGAASALLLLWLMIAASLTAYRANYAIIRSGIQKQRHRGSGDV
jgi:hypothetical protein